MTEKHTPTPWKAYANHIEDVHGLLVGDTNVSCGLTRECDLINAKHIVHCVNLHDELVDAMGSVLDWALYTVAEGNEHSDVLHRGYDEARALLERCKEGRE